MTTGIVATAEPLDGWHDDGVTLVAPNGIHVKAGFRNKVLEGGWDPFNLPYEDEHPMSGVYEQLELGTEGTGQLFRDCYLRADPMHGVHFDRVGNALWVMLKLNTALVARIGKFTTAPLPSLPVSAADAETLAQIEVLLKSILDRWKGASV